MPTQETLLVTYLFMGLFFLCISLLCAVQAARRGYPLLVWVVAGMLGHPIFFLVLLGVMPDRARIRLRKKEMKNLEELLNRQPRREPAAQARPATLPQVRTADPIDRSLGDQPTTMPGLGAPDPGRSMGDDETRL